MPPTQSGRLASRAVLSSSTDHTGIVTAAASNFIAYSPLELATSRTSSTDHVCEPQRAVCGGFHPVSSFESTPTKYLHLDVARAVAQREPPGYIRDCGLNAALACCVVYSYRAGFV